MDEHKRRIFVALFWAVVASMVAAVVVATLRDDPPRDAAPGEPDPPAGGGAVRPAAHAEPEVRDALAVAAPAADPG